MGTISSGVGLVSGMDYQSMITQLLAIDARPRDQLIQRMGRLDAQRTAYADLTARISAMLSHVGSLMKPSTFLGAKASSSNESVLTATAGASSTPGAYRVRVRSLATTHQVVSGRFQFADRPLGLGPVTIESAAARVDRTTRLEELNGGSGIPRGSIELTDRTGATARVDLSDALTLNDVVARINDASVGVDASIVGDHLELRDATTGTGAFRIAEVDGGTTAAGLGLTVGASSSGAVTGNSLLYLRTTTPLSVLRDGLGLRRNLGGGDFQITANRQQIDVDLSGLLKADTRVQRLNSGAGAELGVVKITTKDARITEVDLSGAQTIGEVQQRLQTVTGLSVTLSGGGLVINDGTTADANSPGLKIEDVSGFAARDLGIAGAVDAATGKISGRSLIGMDSVSDVLASINYAASNLGGVTARLAADGQRIELVSDSGPLTLAGGNSPALADLGLAAGDYAGGTVTGAQLTGGINTVLLGSLNGGRGLAAGVMSLQVGDQTINVDATGAETLEDIARATRDALGAANLNVTVGYDRTGTRLQLTSGDNATISATGAMAEALGIAGSGTTIRSANLQRRYVDENTALASLRNGRGISQGQIRITTASGGSAVLDLRSNPPKTVGELMSSIASLGIGVRAEINANGDGIRLVDESRGEGVFKVVDESGTAAKDLNLAGEVNGAEGARAVEGSFEYRIDLGPSGTLQDLARRIAETGMADASVLNDGAALTPYRLSIASRASGLAGELIVSSDDPGWELNTLTRAQDAAVIVGSDSGGGLLVTSSSNTIRNALGGLTLDLASSSSEPVTVQVSQSQEAVITAMKGLLDGFNAALERIGTTSSYDAEKQQRGILLGESAPREAQRRLFDMFTRAIPGASGDIRRLTDLGFKVGAGAKLSFDEEKFKEAYAANPDAVTRFFTDSNTGAGKYLNDKMKEMTESDGLLDRRGDALADMKESMQSRVDSMNAKLERKRERLLRQFQSMEQTLALLQGQQASLSSFGASAPSSAR